MKTAMLKLLIALCVSAMVGLAVVGVYEVALQSQDNPIVAPVNNNIQHLPNQAPTGQPQHMPGKRFAPNDLNLDSPSPK